MLIDNNSIEWSNDADRLMVILVDPKRIWRLRKWARKYPEKVIFFATPERDGYLQAEIPKEWMRMGPPRPGNPNWVKGKKGT